jgi:signal transduction histidine kinase
MAHEFVPAGRNGGLLMIDINKELTIIAFTPESAGLHDWLPDLGQPIDIYHKSTIWDRLNLGLPDVILTTSCDDTHLQWFAALHESYSLEDRPAIILFADDPPPDSYAALIDAVLPRMDHPLIWHQICQAVEQKASIAALHARIHQLESSNRDYKRRQSARSRSADEIELLKNTIVRNVTHELNTPLLQVKSAVALIAEDVQNNTLVDYALRATARLESVVKNITQLAASLGEGRMSALIVRECIDSALRDLRRTWESKDQLTRVHVEIEDNLPLAFGDRLGITTVLQHLIDNALKFSQGTVEVSASLQTDRILIAVRDYGIGIAADHLDDIFESFYQVDASSRRTYGGTGVGLANVRLILDRHGVEIKVESIENRGSTFSFILPVAALSSS